MAQNAEFYEQWIYPGDPNDPNYLGSNELRDDDGVVLPEDHPDRQGVLVSWQGSPEGRPTQTDIRQIFQTLEPAGLITSEDASSVGGLVGSTAPGTAKFIGNRLKDVSRLVSNPAARGAVTAGKFVPGVGWALPLAAGVGGAVGQGYSISQVPKQVGRFDIESWPRSRYGMHYEGAPDTPWEAAHSMLVAGGQEAAGETLGGGLAAGARRLGKWWKGTAYTPQSLRELDRATPGAESREFFSGPQGIKKELAETGTSPTVGSKVRAEDAAKAADEAATGIIKEAETALGADRLVVRLDTVLDDAGKFLDAEVGHRGLQQGLGVPALANESEKIFENIRRVFNPLKTSAEDAAQVFLRPGGKITSEGTVIPIMTANQLRKEAGGLATSAWNAARQSGQTNVPNAAKIQAALNRALTQNIQNTLNRAERAGGGRLQAIKNLGRSGSTRRFGDRWRNQVKYGAMWQRVKGVADIGTGQPIGGLAEGAAAFSVPGLLLGMGQPELSAITSLATLPQLHPLARSLTGGGLYKAGGALGMAPVQGLRGMHIAGNQDLTQAREGYESTPTINWQSFGNPFQNRPLRRRTR